MSKLTAITLFILGALVLFATEILRVYLIMPFPGSQQADTVGLAWSIDHYRLPLRLIGLALIIAPLIRFWRKGNTHQGNAPTGSTREVSARQGSPRQASTPADSTPASSPRQANPRKSKGRIGRRIAISVMAILYAIIFYFFNFRFEADKMFYQPTEKVFADVSTNKVPLNKLVIGIVVGDEARAYPIQIIGYHHQVRDTLGETSVMVTYCTVCRTGRVFNPTLDKKLEDFRLVGMDHFNAMFEDASTKSWWQQATGVSVAGPLKGHRLAELPSEQLTLAQWIEQHPNTTILQPDTGFKKHYDALSLYDNGTIKGGLEHRDSASWKPKSWVVGVRTGEHTKAYDWNTLVQKQLIEDTIGTAPVLLVMSDDSASFRVWNRKVQNETLDFTRLPAQPALPGQSPSANQPILPAKLASASQPVSPGQQAAASQPLFVDNTGSQWDADGHCISGRFKDQQLQSLQSYQEFWHSWNNFHPLTTQYKL